jgi:hypothetical protein
MDDSTPTKVRLKDMNGKHAREMARWALAVDLARGFPFSQAELEERSIAQLRFLARLCPDFVQREVFNKSKRELITWILGYQPRREVAPWPPPIQIADLPCLEEIRPPRR